MDFSMRKDLSNLGFLSAAVCYMANKPKWARYLGAGALGLRFWPLPPLSYSRKSVIITGGSRGLGLALAEELTQAGAFVTILARDQEELNRAQNQLEKIESAQVLALKCDVNDSQQIHETFQKVIQRFGTIDILINNAGSIAAGPFESMNIQDFQAQMNLHFFAALKTIQAALPVFKSQRSGRIVNISSIGGKIPVPHMISYCASKFALSGFSQGLSAELRKDNILVTTVYPGLMRTGSPIQGVFKGDAKKEFAWFALSDSTPGLTVSARNAARQILSAVQKGESELVISLPAKLGTLFYSNLPQLYTSLMGVINRLLPRATNDERKTGAQVRGWLDEKSWAKPFIEIMRRAQSQWNEHGKSDPDFNLNAY